MLASLIYCALILISDRTLVINWTNGGSKLNLDLTPFITMRLIKLAEEMPWMQLELEEIIASNNGPNV